MLEKINVILFRIENELFSFSDLNFLTGFTIYEIDGNVLRKIPNADHGTTGASKDVIPLDDGKYENYASVRLAKEKDKTKYTLPLQQEVRNGYYIVSYRMNMGIDPNKIWIFNFHVNSETNEMAWNLLQNDDILNVSEVYRLFHALCLIILRNENGMEEFRNVSS
ncbi:hypothetical protein [Scopulibacillus darangshiensis]|uniref:hypothetical protein n=1 Tax=Scopulibacillus darangshiensis TaxID=442528 RepID=UPI0010452C8C|nr:hypothetical protein [Scopulibacillus darangshiensis]